MKKFTLDEAIEHAEEVARRNERKAKYARNHGGYFYFAEAKSCDKCAEEHRQLAEWLKDYREMLNNVENEPLTYDELKEMDMKPVWYESLYWEMKAWGKVLVQPEGIYIDIVSRRKNGQIYSNRFSIYEDQQGEMWQIYRKERK